MPLLISLFVATVLCRRPLLPLKYGLLSTFAGICPEDFACLRKVIVYQGLRMTTETGTVDMKQMPSHFESENIEKKLGSNLG